MFDFSDDDLLIEGNEVKPNTYIARALLVGIIALIVCIIFNEVGIFLVDKVKMRISCGIALAFCVLPQILAYNKKTVGKKWCKYVMLLCVLGLTAILGLCLFVFVAPLCLLPLLLAVQYNSRKFSRLAIIGTCVIVVVTTPLGCIMGLWQTNFLDYLVRHSIRSYVEYTAEVKAEQIAAGTPLSNWEIIGHISLYISLPWLMCVLLASKLIQSIAQKGEESIKAQLQIRKMSKIDALTGLYNQNVYRKFVENDCADGKIGVLFFDVDGLKVVNDEHGHEFGDLLLQNCARSLFPLFDENCCGFRVGGDEFVVLIETDDAETLDDKIAVWRESISAINAAGSTGGKKICYRMSVGKALGNRADLEKLVADADMSMYEEKKEYYACMRR